VAAVLPGRTVADVTAHYDDLEFDVGSIEAGFVPFPRCGGGASQSAAGFTFEVGGTSFKRSCHVVGSGKRERGPDHERKKDIPWTEEEHKYEIEDQLTGVVLAYLCSSSVQGMPFLRSWSGPHSRLPLPTTWQERLKPVPPASNVNPAADCDAPPPQRGKGTKPTSMEPTSNSRSS
jgi:hypothetical protein